MPMSPSAPQAQRLLFITSTRIGDAVFSSGVLGHLLHEYPNHSVTIVCGPLCTSLFEGVPRLENLISLKKERWNRHWWTLWKQVWPTQWDIVVDLRNSLVSRLIPARIRHIHDSRINRTIPKSAQNAAAVGLAGKDVPPPRLFPTNAQKKKARHWIPDGPPVLAIGPTANWIGKTWPLERYIALAHLLLSPGGPCADWRLAVFAGEGEEKDAAALLDTVPPAKRIDGIAKGTPGEVGAALARCQIFIGNDSGLTHMAAAAGIRTLGLYGPSFPDIYAPSGPMARHVRTPESSEDLIGFPGYHPAKLTRSLMESLSVEAAHQGVLDLLSAFPFQGGADDSKTTLCGGKAMVTVVP